MSRIRESAIGVNEAAAMQTEPSVESVLPKEPSALAKVTFYDLYIFLWKLVAAMVVFAIPFLIIFLAVMNR